MVYIQRIPLKVLSRRFSASLRRPRRLCHDLSLHLDSDTVRMLKILILVSVLISIQGHPLMSGGGYMRSDGPKWRPFNSVENTRYPIMPLALQLSSLNSNNPAIMHGSGYVS